MSNWQIGESGTDVALKGRPLIGEISFTVTNSGTAQDRSVLTITPLDGAAEPWFEVEEPQRVVPPGASATYLCRVKIPDGTPAARYGMQAVVYSADRDPGETSAESRRVAIVVPETDGGDGTPWWVFAIVAAILLVVAAVIAWLVWPDDGPGELASVAAPTIEGDPEVGQMLAADAGTWSEPNDELTFAMQWQRCNADGEACTDIEGATGESYEVAAEDEASRLSVVVTATADDDRSSSAESETTDPVRPARIPVPDVIGLSPALAMSGLQDMGFVVERKETDEQSFLCDPPVEAQDPAAGTLLDPGATVVIVTDIPLCIG